jgi:hypothetical protein
MVEKGFAQWLILGQTTVTGKEICSICLDDKIKKGCQHCRGTGQVEKSYPINTYGSDIVLVTTGSLDDDEQMVYKPILAQKTPRVATIEKAHIERAYVQNDKDEQERIEFYGLMTLESRIEMGIGVEPSDDPETGTGRKYDTGRSPFARISDERTSLGLGKIGARIVEGYKTINTDGKDGEE